MPYRWTETSDEQRLDLWPHRSLTPQGFAIFIGITAAFFLIPLLALVGTVLLWGLLPFLAGTLALIWYFLRRNGADLQLSEQLVLRHNEIHVTRTNPRQPKQIWQSNPYWVRVILDEDNGPVPDYLTLKGSDREVELGAFLSPEERVRLYHDLRARLNRMDRNAH